MRAKPKLAVGVRGALFFVSFFCASRANSLWLFEPVGVKAFRRRAKAQWAFEPDSVLERKMKCKNINAIGTIYIKDKRRKEYLLNTNKINRYSTIYLRDKAKAQWAFEPECVLEEIKVETGRFCKAPISIVLLFL